VQGHDVALANAMQHVAFGVDDRGLACFEVDLEDCEGQLVFNVDVGSHDVKVAAAAPAVWSAMVACTPAWTKPSKSHQYGLSSPESKKARASPRGLVRQ